MGFTSPGLSLVDLPGLGESSFLDASSIKQGQQAAIIVYVLDSSTVAKFISDDHAGWLALQARHGCACLFVFNRKENVHSKEEIEESLNLLKQELKKKDEFRKSEIYDFDIRRWSNTLKKEPFLPPLTKQKKLSMDQEKKFGYTLIATLATKIRSTSFYFARTYFQYLQLQYLVTSKVISSSMHSSSLFKKKKDKDVALNQMKQIRKDINNLVQTADEKIAELKKEHVALFHKTITETSSELNQRAITCFVNSPFVPMTQSNWTEKLKMAFDRVSRTAPPFESELTMSLLNYFVDHLNRNHLDWITRKQFEFTSTLLKQAQEIENNMNSLKMSLSEDTLTLKMFELLQSNERQIGQLAIGAGIGGPILAVLLGSGAVTVAAGGVLLIGAAASAVLFAGFLVVGGLFITLLAAGIGALYTQHLTKRTEEDARKEVYDMTIKYLQQMPNTKEFQEIEEASLRVFIQIRDYVYSTLATSLLQVDSISCQLPEQDLPYKALCSYLYRREILQEKFKNLNDILKRTDSVSTSHLDIIEKVSKKWKTYGSVPADIEKDSQAIVQPSLPRCFICQGEFSRCSHLCANCQCILNYKGQTSRSGKAWPCPACHKSKYLLGNMKGGKGHQFLDNLMHQMLETSSIQDSETQMALEALNKDAFVFGNAIKARKPVFDQFISWYQNTHNVYSSSLIPAKDAVFRFTEEFARNVEQFAVTPFNELQVQRLIEAIQREIYPGIYESLIGLYRHEYKKKDENIYSTLQSLKDNPPSFFEVDKSFDSLATTAEFGDCIRLLQQAVESPCPFEALYTLEKLYYACNELMKEKTVAADDIVPLMFCLIAKLCNRYMYSTIVFLDDHLQAASFLQPVVKYVFVTVQSLVMNLPVIAKGLLEPIEERVFVEAEWTSPVVDLDASDSCSTEGFEMVTESAPSPKKKHESIDLSTGSSSSQLSVDKSPKLLQTKFRAQILLCGGDESPIWVEEKYKVWCNHNYKIPQSTYFTITMEGDRYYFYNEGQASYLFVSPTALAFYYRTGNNVACLHDKIKNGELFYLEPLKNNKEKFAIRAGGLTGLSQWYVSLNESRRLVVVKNPDEVQLFHFLPM